MIDKSSVLQHSQKIIMPKNYPAAIEAILSRGMDLEEFGSANWALHRSAALDAIAELHELGIPVLGGDVWEIREGRPVHTLDTWFYQRSAGELFQVFLEESIERARSYVRSYGPSGSDNYLFEIVIDRSEAGKRNLGL